MISNELRFLRPSRELRELQIMAEIESNARVSQRALAKKALVTSTMVNNYITEMVSNGLVEVDGSTNRSFRYRLTDLGLERKRELVALASREIVQFYGMIKKDFRGRVEALRAEGIRRAVLYGATETAELVCAAACDTGLEIVGVVDADRETWGRKVAAFEVRDPSAVLELRPDAVLVTAGDSSEMGVDRIPSLENTGIRFLKWTG